MEYRDGNETKTAALKLCRAQPYFIEAMRQEICIFKQIVSRFPEITAEFLEEFSIGQHVCYSMELFDQTLFQALK